MTTIDDLGRRAAAAALEDARRTADVEARLAELRGGSAVRVAPKISPRPRRWLVLASAAAVVAMIAGIAVIVRQQDGQTQVKPIVDTSVTATPPASTTASPTTVTETTVTETTVSQTSSVPTTVAPSAPVGPAVSYRDPPPMFEPVVFATVPITRDPTNNASAARIPDMAVMEGAVAVVDMHGTTILIVDSETGAIRSVPADVMPMLPVGGPGDVLYGIDSAYEGADGFHFVAIALSGARAGEVVASNPVDMIHYLEIGPGVFGHGLTGIVDRARNVGTQVIQYVDVNGDPAALTPSVPFFTMLDDVVSGTDPSMSWSLEIERHPDAAELYVGEAPPAATLDEAAVVWTWIGPAAGSPDDFPPPTMPVVAWLNADGTVAWRQLPEGWQVVSSDLWGTLLAHQIDDHVELAWLTPPAESSVQTDLTLEPLGIGPFECVSGSCPTIAFDDNGSAVSYDPVARTLTVHEPAAKPRTVDVSEIGELDPSFSWLVDVGPDDVAYLATQRIGQTDPIGDVLAVPLSGPSAGQVVQRGEGIDLSGDSDLVASTYGLVVVGCCDFSARRPAADADLVIPWVDQTGQPSPIDEGSELWLEFRDDASLVVNLTRVDGLDSTWTIAGVSGFRGMPPLIGTNDGGAVISLHDSFDTQSVSRIVVMHPDGSMEEHSIAPYFPHALAPDGSVIVFDDAVGYARVVLDD